MRRSWPSTKSTRRVAGLAGLCSPSSRMARAIGRPLPRKRRSFWRATRWRRCSAATRPLHARRCCRCSSATTACSITRRITKGLEMSKNIMYTGQEATQSVIPAVNWLAQNKGKKFYLIGSDYIWPRTTNRIARPTIAKAGGTVVGEDYFPLGNVEFSSVINKIKAAKPDVILSTVVGGSNVALYKQLNSVDITGRNQTILALSVTEEEAIGI